MAKSDYDLIFTTSFGYMNPTLKVAKQFPKVTFEHATGYKQAKNVGTYRPAPMRVATSADSRRR